jgi:hypothetical protein
MDIKELNQTIETIETSVQTSARGDDNKFLIGLLVRGIYEVARQLAIMNERQHG